MNDGKNTLIRIHYLGISFIFFLEQPYIGKDASLTSFVLTDKKQTEKKQMDKEASFFPHAKSLHTFGQTNILILLLTTKDFFYSCNLAY
jgi:hypothetical protein